MKKIYPSALLLLLAYTLTAIPVPAFGMLPLITQQPSHVVVACLDEPATLSVVATGNNLRYQWYRNNAPVPGATQPSYTIPSVKASHLGFYRVRVNEADFSRIENSLNVDLSQGIVALSGEHTGFMSRRFSNCGRGPTMLAVHPAGTDFTFQWFRGVTPIPATASSFILDTVRGQDVGSYRVVASGPCGPSVSASFSVVLEKPVQLFGWSESRTVRPGAIVTHDVLLKIHTIGANLKYQWYRDKIPLSSVQDQIVILDDVILINNVSAEDAGIYSVEVSNGCSKELSGGIRLMIAYSSGPADRTVCSGQLARFVAPDTTDEFTYQWRKNGVDIPGATEFFMEIPSAQLDDQGMYTVAITLKETNAMIETPPGRLTVTKSAEFITEPQSQVLCHGEPLRLTAEAVGDSLTYQWWKSGMKIPGATSPTYELASAIPSNAGFYQVVVTGTCGDLLSEPAFVSVAARTMIEQQPVGRTVKSGESVTFFVTATGTDLKYQWRKNGVDMVTYEDTYITLAQAHADHEGTYDVVITDGCGRVTVSDPAVLVVRLPALVADVRTIEKAAMVVVRPHPANGTTHLEVRLPERLRLDGRSVLSFYDMRGSHVLDIDVEPSDGSTVTGMFDASELAAGVYHLRLTSGGVGRGLGVIVVAE